MNRVNYFYIIAIAIFVLSACSPPNASLESPTPHPATPTPTFTQTPTLTPTSSPSPSSTPAPSPTSPPLPTPTFPGPSQESAIDIPPPVDPIMFAPDTVNIILLGSDKRPNLAGYRTDTLMIASLNPAEGTGTLLSIPRDLYVYIPGWKINRINTAEPRGGFEMIANTVLYNFGIPLQHWVRVQFSGLSQAVNLLGGINVQSTGNLYDECGGTYYSYGPGEYSMDGFTALCYVRMRKTSSDFDRLRRQQEMVRAMFAKVISIDGLERVPELFDLFGETFATDMRLDDLLELVPLAASLAVDPASIRQFSITQSMTQAFRVPGTGAAVLLPKRDLIDAMLQEAFGN